MILMMGGYVAIFYYFRNVSTMKDLQTATAVKSLETSLASLESKMKNSARELNEKKSSVEEKEQELKAKGVCACGRRWRCECVCI